MPRSTPEKSTRPARTRRRTPSQERSVEMVRTLLDATAHVLTDVGIERLSTNKVAARAGVAVGTIYQYFPNKEALIDALVEDRMHQLKGLVADRMASLGSYTFPAAAEAMLWAVIEFLSDQSGLVPVLMSRALYASGETVAGQLRAEAEAAARAFLGRMDIAVTDIELAVFVSTNVAGLFGALLANPAIDHSRREVVIREIVRMLSSWMATPPR